MREHRSPIKFQLDKVDEGDQRSESSDKGDQRIHVGETKAGEGGAAASRQWLRGQLLDSDCLRNRALVFPLGAVTGDWQRQSQQKQIADAVGRKSP